MTSLGWSTGFQVGDPSPIVTLQPKGFESRRVQWGHAWQFGTAQYWVAATHERAMRGRELDNTPSHRLGSNLIEEVAACLLGGFGMPYEIGLAAFWAVRDAGLLEQRATPVELEQVLRNPLRVDRRTIRYRFPAQRARYLSHILGELHSRPAPRAALELRNWLLQMPGIGPKTASWIVRNHLCSDQVAIIDVHVLRAGVHAGVFDPSWTVSCFYPCLEAHFLAWAQTGRVRAADLDATIWAESAYMARSSALA